MAKFKVGDFVVPKEGHYTGNTPGSLYNLPRTPLRVAESGVGYIVVEIASGETAPAMNPESFVLAESLGPVRTVTRREIVPGIYGPIKIGAGGTVGFDSYTWRGSPRQLREAAILFNELADVLQENAH